MIMGYQLDVFQFGIGEFVVMACEQIESYIFGATIHIKREEDYDNGGISTFQLAWIKLLSMSRARMVTTYQDKRQHHGRTLLQMWQKDHGHPSKNRFAVNTVGRGVSHCVLLLYQQQHLLKQSPVLLKTLPSSFQYHLFS
jgi:hypothetical protein